MNQLFKTFIILFCIVFTNVNANTDITLQLSWKHQFQFAGYYMAKEKGFYKDVGLNVNIKEFDHGINVTDDVVNGKADFGIGYSSLIYDRYKEKPIVLLAAMFQHAPGVLLAKKRDDIQSIEDFKNKKIMLTSSQVAMVSINAMLQSHLITPQMYKEEKHSFNVQDLIDGKTDVMFAYISNEPYALEEKNIPYRIFSPKDYGFDFYSDILFTSENMIKKHPDTVRKFREASLKGLDYALTHKDEAIELILQKYNTQNKSKKAYLYEAKTTDKLINKDEVPLGDINPKKIKNIMQVYSLMGLMLKHKSVDDFIYKVEESKNFLNLTQEEENWLKKHPNIVLGADQNWQPFDFKNSLGNHDGFNADFIELLRKKLGVNIQVELGVWGELQDKVKNKQLAGLVGPSKTDERDKYMEFTKPYFVLSQVILMRHNAPSLTSLNDLDNKTLALKLGSSNITYFQKKYPKIKQKIYNTNAEVIRAVSLGEVDAGVSNIGTASYEMERNFISNIKVGYDIAELSGDMRFGIRKDWPELVTILQKGIDAITREEKNVILNKWLKLAAKNDNVPNVNLTQEEKNWIKNNSVKVGGEMDWPPYDFVKDGQYQGLSRDIIELISKSTGLKVDYITGQTWNELVNDFKNEKLDVMPAFYHTKEREDFTIYTKPYLNIKDYAFVKEDDNTVTNTNDLRYKKIAIIDGYAIEDNLKEKFPDIKLLKVQSATEGIDAVLTNKADVYIDAYPTVMYLLSNNAESGVKAAFHVDFYKNELRIGIQKTEPLLASIIQKGLDAISPKEKTEIFKKWTAKKEIELDLTKKEKAWLDKNIPIKYVYDANWEPFEWQNELGDHTGILYDILSLVEQRTGIDFQQVPTKNWNEALTLMKDNKADMVSGIGRNSHSSKYLNFSKNAIFKTPYVFVTRVDDTKEYLDTLKTIENNKVATVKNYTIEHILKDKNPNLPLLTVDNIKEGFDKVKDKSIDIFIVNATTAKYYINKKGYSDLKIATKTEFNLELKIALQKDFSKETLSIIDKGIASLSNKEISDIYHKWTEVTVEEKIDWTLLFQIGGVVFVIIALGVYNNRKLKYLVNEKTAQLQSTLKAFDEHVIASNTDLKGRITYVSDAFCEISGYSREELIGKPHNISRHPDMPKEAFKDLWQTIKKGESWNGEVKNIKKDGGFYWVEANVSPLFNSKNEIIGYSSIRHDITAQKEVEELSASLEQKVEERTKQLAQNTEQMTYVSKHANLGFWNFNPQIGDLYVNDVFVEMLGYDAKDVLLEGYENEMFKPFKDGLAFWEQLLHPDDAQRTGEIITAHINGEIDLYNVEYRMRRVDGSWMWSRAVGRISEFDKDGKPIKFNGVNIDIDEAKKAQEEIEEQRVFIDSIMNTQENFVITSDGKCLRSANRAFFEFYGIKDTDEFIEKFGNCICDTFDKNAAEEYIQKFMGEETWIDYIYNRPNQVHKTMIKKDDKDYIFTITTDKVLFKGEELKTAVFTDITIVENAKQEIEAIHKHTRESIEYASLIQQALIPEKDSFKKYFDDFFTIWQPKDTVGGDIYLFEELRDEDECLLMVIDCTGHGVPGAFVTMLVKAIERQLTAYINNSDEDVSPANLLSLFNKSMKHLLKQEDSSSVSNAGFDGGILYYNKKDKVIKFAGAETALFYIEEDQFKTIKGSRHSVGYKKSDPNFEFKEHTIEVKDGMQFYLTTDGYLDQNGGEKGFPFGKKQFIRIVEENKIKLFEDQKRVLLEELITYQKDEERNDDVTVVGFKI